MGKSSKIVYFDDEGRANLDETLSIVAARMRKPGVDAVVIFTLDGVAAVKLSKMLPRNKRRIVATSFPAYHSHFDEDGNGVDSKFIQHPELVGELQKVGIPLVMGNLPLSDIITPRSEDPKLAGIRNALRLFGGGTSLCVQAVTMATDAGYISPGDRVITFSADTALVVTATSTAFMFHPVLGMKIEEILCKPINMSITYSS